MQCHAQFGMLAGVPEFLWVKSTVTSPSGHSSKVLGSGQGQAHGQGWAPTECLHCTELRTSPLWPLYLQVFPLTGELQVAFVDCCTHVSHTLGFFHQRR